MGNLSAKILGKGALAGATPNNSKSQLRTIFLENSHHENR